MFSPQFLENSASLCAFHFLNVGCWPFEGCVCVMEEDGCVFWWFHTLACLCKNNWRCSRRSEYTLASGVKLKVPGTAVRSSVTFHTITLSSPPQVLRESPDQAGLLDVDVFEEVETVGKALLDRLTVPVIFPDGWEFRGHTGLHRFTQTPAELYNIFFFK